MLHFRTATALAALATLSLAAALPAAAQTAYGVDAGGKLFKFDVNAPAAVSDIGNLGFVPEGIDFRPGSNMLYAIDIGPATSQLYTVNLGNGAATPVGAGFASAGTVGGRSYDLSVKQTYGFDFNPTTLQADNSMRIRLVGSGGSNLRLHSATGGIAAVDTPLAFASGAVPAVDGAAYINNLPTMGGATALYDMDSRNDALLLQNPPNNGTVTSLGNFGVTIDANPGIGFDIYTAPGSADPTNDDDLGFAVLTRPDAPLGGPLGSYLLYKVNLDNGQLTDGALVGPAAMPYDFTGGFAINPVPEPGTWAMLGIGLAGLSLVARKRARAAN